MKLWIIIKVSKWALSLLSNTKLNIKSCSIPESPQAWGKVNKPQVYDRRVFSPNRGRQAEITATFWRMNQSQYMPFRRRKYWIERLLCDPSYVVARARTYHSKSAEFSRLKDTQQKRQFLGSIFCLNEAMNLLKKCPFLVERILHNCC